jgi:hypothetical protein
MNLSQTTETWGNEDLSWLGSAHGLEMADSVTLDRALLDAAWLTDGTVPAGAIVRRVNATGRYAAFGDVAADGPSGIIIGPVMTGAAGNPVGAVIRHGQVIVAKLPATSGYVAGVDAELPLVDFV